MERVSDIKHLISNLKTLEYLLTSGTTEEQEYARKILKRGTCYVAYSSEGEMRFAPSRFVGYLGINIHKHQEGIDLKIIHGSRTNSAINRVLGNREPSPSKELRIKLLEYGESFGLKVDDKKHKFWNLDKLIPSKTKETEDKGFLEGSVSYRIHRNRERNSQVVNHAKNAFKEKHGGKLFCEACKFNFEEKYGERGLGFIEAHHIIPISQLEPNSKTKIEDLIMLCANCHKMIHRSDEVESLNEFKKIIN